MTEELKPCKRCGGIARPMSWDLGGTILYWFVCVNNGCRYKTEYFSTPEAAIEEWNEPTEEQKLRAELDSQNTILSLVRADLAAAQAEVERLKVIIRNVENFTFDWRGEECRNCCDSHPNEEHEPECALYQWEGGAQ